MTLRGPAAHRRGSSDWTRSGDDSFWESYMPEGEVLRCASCTQRAPRPQSAIEGGQLDGWLQHLQRHPLNTPVHHQVPPFNERTTSMPTLSREPARRALRSPGNLSSRRDSYSCGSPTLYGSSVGSQESLHCRLFSPPEPRGSWGRAHIMQAPRKEQAKLSSLAPVKTGWLPVQRRVMVADVCSQNQYLDHSASQVKLKQPITPLFQRHSAASRHWDGEVGKSPGSQNAVGVRRRQAPDQASPVIKQVQEKTGSAANEWSRPSSWQALRRGWSTNRISGVSQSHELPTKASSDPHKNNPLIRATSAETYERTPLHRAASSEPWSAGSQLQGTNGIETSKLHTSHTRRRSLTTPPSISEPAYAQTSSAVTTLIPRRNTGLSFITISSRKVTRSASLPDSNVSDHSHANHTRNSPSPPVTHHTMDSNSSQVTPQRKAAIVKVTEHRTTSGPAQCAKQTENSPANHGSDTVVRRRKATIIKVTEHRESYSPARTEYRHSYTDGVNRQNGVWNQGKLDHTPSCDHLASPERPNSSVSPHATNSVVLKEPENSGGTLHRSTLSLILGNPPPTQPVGQRSQRPSRPLSCYGNVFGHTEPSEESAARPNARKWSFELPRETDVNPVNPGGSFTRSGTAVKEAGQTVKPNGDENERRPLPQDAARRASPSLTLIKAPDPCSQQSAEEVLALNAAAIIANIKLQQQLSKKKTPNGNSERDSVEAPRGNTDVGKRTKPHPDQRPVRQQDRPHAEFVRLRVDPDQSAESVSLQEALQRCRPDFISRSQHRVRELERRARERRGGELSDSADPQRDAAPRQKRDHRLTPPRDNLFKPRDRAITGKEMQLRCRRNLAEVKRKTEEEQKRKVCLSNRQRVELFKKKLLDQVLQRSNNN